MPAFSQQEVAPIFIGTWIVLAVLSSAIFFPRGVKAAIKRRLWPVFGIATGVLFVMFVWLMDRKTSELFLMIPVVALITFINLRSIRFCLFCNSLQRSPNFIVAPKFCQKCGHALDSDSADTRPRMN
jgi:hypothetical protein